MSDDYSDSESNPYWDMIMAVSQVGPYFRDAQDLMRRYPTEDARTLYRLEYRLEDPGCDEKSEEGDGLGVWTIGLGPLMTAYLHARVDEHGLNHDIESERAQVAIREHMFRFVMMQQMQARPESVMMIPVDLEGEDGD